MSTISNTVGFQMAVVQGTFHGRCEPLNFMLVYKLYLGERDREREREPYYNSRTLTRVTVLNYL
jgi:hypothetical protein